MRILYHFPMSPFSRRARLSLAHKGLEVELRDARSNPAFLEEAREKSPLRTMPVLVEDDGRAIGESGAIVHYLDSAYPDAPRLWPADPEDAAPVYGTTSLVDGVLNTLVDHGTRIFQLRSHEAWEGVKGEAMRRAQGALDKLAADVPRLGRATIARSGWSAADIWLFTAVRWLEALPARAETFAPAAQIMSLGWSLPESLSRWADAHRERADVRALDD
jgi:glutathione S-transferase